MKASEIKTLIAEMTNKPASEIKTLDDAEAALLKIMEYTKKKRYLAKKSLDI